MDTGWLSRRRADLDAGDRWLGENERRAAARLTVDKRRGDWLLGRLTAKAAIAAWLRAAPDRVEILAAPDGAPEASLDGAPLPLSVSISHRGDRALAAVTAAPGVVGCDLELVEPRSGAFVREWLAASEQRVLRTCGEGEHALLANVFWAAKEATAKVLRLGLALNVRRAVVTLSADRLEPPAQRWETLRVDWSDGSYAPTLGWWRTEPGWVMVIAGRPASAEPRELSAQTGTR
jgi:4'-phosphopantetheinyl transferase